MRDVGKLIDRARTFVRAEPTAAVWERVEEAAKFSEPAGEAQIAFWTYHVTGNDMAPMFSAMLSHQAAMCFKFSPGSRHSVVFGDTLNMFDRCLAMCAYVHSPAFNAPTVFLDSDAFPNGDLRPVFEQITDIGLTLRDVPGLMPVNEGVILAKPDDSTLEIFRSYLGTYEALREMLPEPDWKWMGGQLSLCALADSPSVERLACELYNFSPDMKKRYRREELDEKLIIHCKGGRKIQFDQVMAYQNARQA